MWVFTDEPKDDRSGMGGIDGGRERDFLMGDHSALELTRRRHPSCIRPLITDQAKPAHVYRYGSLFVFRPNDQKTRVHDRVRRQRFGIGPDRSKGNPRGQAATFYKGGQRSHHHGFAGWFEDHCGLLRPGLRLRVRTPVRGPIVVWVFGRKP